MTSTAKPDATQAASWLPLGKRPAPHPPVTEMTMACAIARARFSDCLLAMDNCNWPGSECDLLVVTPKLRIIDVEVKISRADLKVDKKKQKWWSVAHWRDPPRTEPRSHPQKVWQHYYAMPGAIWTEDLLEHIPPASGILLVCGTTQPHPWNWTVVLKRRAQSCKDVKPLEMVDVLHLARLASFRMWNAYDAAGWTAA